MTDQHKPSRMHQQNPSMTVTSPHPSIQKLIFSGHWVSLLLSPEEKNINTLLATLTSSETIKHDLEIYFDDSFIADMAGAWIIGQFIYHLNQSQYKIKGTIPETIRRYINKHIKIPEEPHVNGLLVFLESVGKRTLILYDTIRSMIAFLGEIIVNLWRPANSGSHPLKHQKAIRWVSVVHHLDVTGFRAIPIISLISFLIGAVIAYQGIKQLTRFGASIYTVDLLAISLLRELSVLLTSIVIAGRSGSAFTAQIGTMALNQEIDAIRMLGLSPIQVLVIPRVIGLLIALPLLVLLSTIMGALGGMIVTKLSIDLSYAQYWELFRKAVEVSTFWVGMSKAPLFALIISVVGCYRGMQVKGSAESVGAMTTQSVVESIFLVIICDGFMSILYSSLDI